MRRTLLFSLLVIGMCLSVSAVYGQDYSRRFALGLGGGIWKMGLTERSDSNTVGNFGTLLFKYKLKERISLAFSILAKACKVSELPSSTARSI